MRTIVIVGAGMMGAQIAAANVKHGCPVVLIDSNPSALAAAERRIASELGAGAGSPSHAADLRAARLVTTTTDLARARDGGLVLESIFENASAKQTLFTELEPHLAPDAVLASNTSTLPIARLAIGLSDPSRLCGLHFLHPVRHRPLVEVIRGPLTSDRTVAVVMDHVQTIGKVPLLVHDGPGFVVNRLLMPYLGEALDLLLEGASLGQIERAAIDFGMDMGPLRLADEIGLDTLLAGGRILWEAFPERIVPSPLLVALYKKGRYGRKAGSGFYAYPQDAADDEPGCPDPSVQEIVSTWARAPLTFADETIVDRLLLPVVLEATRMLEEKAVCSPSEIDDAMVLGLGFPAAKGGPLKWADQRGLRSIFAALQPHAYLGSRFYATALLEEMARQNARFYC